MSVEELLLNIESKEIRAAHLRNGKLYDLQVERKRERQLTGNIYCGRVTNILENIQSAFIDIDEGDNGFIHINDILENTKKFEEMFDLDFDLDYDISKTDIAPKKQQDIEQFLKKDQKVLVQVVKEPIGSKGARLTSNISVAGRYLVLLPNSSHRGVSRKIEDRTSRERLKRLIRAFELPQEMGLICRTAAKVATADMLIDEAHELLIQWNQIMELFQKTENPTLLHAESDIIKRSMLTAIDKRFSRVLIDDYDVYHQCKKLYDRYSEEHQMRLEFYRDVIPMFERFNVEKEFERSLRRKIWLPQGGYLYFDRTEAMHTIDVNSGRSTTVSADVEEALVKINLESAEEIARQLRIRNVGGLIIIDFIDMRFRKNKRRVLEKLKDCLKDDPAKCTVLGMSDFGLVEMTRQRSRGSLMQTIFTECPYCHGNGMIKNYESTSIELERALKKAIRCHEHYAIRVEVHPLLNDYIRDYDRGFLEELAEKLNAKIDWMVNDELHLNEYRFYSTTSQQQIPV